MSAKRNHRGSRLTAATLILIAAAAGCIKPGGMEPAVTWARADDSQLIVNAGWLENARPIVIQCKFKIKPQKFAARVFVRDPLHS